MGFEIITLSDDWIEPDQRLYKTEAGEIVEEGHPEARWLVAVPGKRIHRSEAERLGILGGDKPSVADQKVDEVLEYVGDDPEKAAEVLEVEKGGKNRKTLVAALEQLIADSEGDGGGG